MHFSESPFALHNHRPRQSRLLFSIKRNANLIPFNNMGTITNIDIEWHYVCAFVFLWQILATLLVGCAFAAPAQQQRQLRQTEFQQPTTEPIPIISQEQEVNYDGTYKWAYETGKRGCGRILCKLKLTFGRGNIMFSNRQRY